MTLNEFFSTLKTSAIGTGDPLIKSVLQSPKQLDYLHDIKYGVFIFDTVNISVKDGFTTWIGNLYYVNRLYDIHGVGLKTTDGLATTEVEDQAYYVQSQGVDFLYNLIYSIDGIAVIDVSFQPFTHKFLDYCAGVMANVTVKFPYLRTSCLPGMIWDGDLLIGTKVIKFTVSGSEVSAYRAGVRTTGEHPWLWVDTHGTPNWYTDENVPEVGDLVWNEAGTVSYTITSVE